MTLTKLAEFPDGFHVTRFYANGSTASTGIFSDINDAQEWASDWVDLNASNHPEAVQFSSMGLVLPIVTPH